MTSIDREQSQSLESGGPRADAVLAGIRGASAGLRVGADRMGTSLGMLGCALGAAAFGLAAHLSPLGAVEVLATFAAMAAGGVALLGRAVPWERSRLCVIVFGSILGLTLGRVGLVITGLVPALRAQGLLIVAVASLALAAVITRGRVWPHPGTDEDKHEAPWITGMIAVVLLLIAPPFWGLGRLTERGYAFVANFNIDFIQHAEITAELTRGIPPQNPLFAGERLHYYWFYHLWPAAVAGLTGVTAREAVELTIPITAALFVAALALALRFEVPARRARFFGIGLGLFAYSYIGLLFVLTLLLPAVAPMIPTHHRLGYTLLSHSWYRDFLYEPHAVTALTLLLLAFYLDRVSAKSRAPLPRLLMGFALGVMLMTDSVIALMGLGWWGALYLWRFVRARESRGLLVVPLVALVAVVGGIVALGVFPSVSSGARPLGLGVHPVAKFGPVYLLVELGPLFLFGLAGLIALLASRRLNGRGDLLVLLGLSVLCAFFVAVPIQPDHVLRKAVKLLQIPLVVLAADAYGAYISRPVSRWLAAGFAIALVAGSVTLGTDMFQYVDLMGKKVQPTIYVSQDEMQVLNWIRTHTPRDAVFQELSEVRPGQRYGDNIGSLVAMFGERRTLVGDSTTPQMFQVPGSKLAGRRQQLERLFTAQDPGTALRVLEQVRPDYLYVEERLPGPVGIIRRLAAAGMLQETYRVGGISVLKMKAGGRAGGGIDVDSQGAGGVP